MLTDHLIGLIAALAALVHLSGILSAIHADVRQNPARRYRLGYFSGDLSGWRCRCTGFLAETGFTAMPKPCAAAGPIRPIMRLYSSFWSGCAIFKRSCRPNASVILQRTAYKPDFTRGNALDLLVDG